MRKIQDRNNLLLAGNPDSLDLSLIKSATAGWMISNCNLFWVCNALQCEEWSATYINFSFTLQCTCIRRFAQQYRQCAVMQHWQDRRAGKAGKAGRQEKIRTSGSDSCKPPASSSGHHHACLMQKAGNLLNMCLLILCWYCSVSRKFSEVIYDHLLQYAKTNSHFHHQ